ncbi:MAG TPA: formate/nitrite transporter family protein [Blastocatellia bacterium]
MTADLLVRGPETSGISIALVIGMSDPTKRTVAVVESEAKAPAAPEQTETTGAGTRLTADEIYENVRVAAEFEMKRPASALFWSALAAGLTIGFSFLGGSYANSLVPPRFGVVAAAAVYPLGFVFVVIARNQLFTENTLEPIIPLLHSPGRETLKKLISLWTVVLTGNMIGTLIFAYVLARTPVMSMSIEPSLQAVARLGTSGGFVHVLYHGVFAGWLIALMAWLVASTRETVAQVILIVLTTAPISAFGFNHSIAGSVEAFYRAASGSAGWLDMVAGFVIPATLGNIIGGILLVALLNHGQVVAGRTNNHGEEDSRPGWGRDYK